jgi:hypothetical protein
VNQYYSINTQDQFFYSVSFCLLVCLCLSESEFSTDSHNRHSTIHTHKTQGVYIRIMVLGTLLRPVAEKLLRGILDRYVDFEGKNISLEVWSGDM